MSAVSLSLTIFSFDDKPLRIHVSTSLTVTAGAAHSSDDITTEGMNGSGDEYVGDEMSVSI